MYLVSIAYSMFRFDSLDRRRTCVTLQEFFPSYSRKFSSAYLIFGSDYSHLKVLWVRLLGANSRTQKSSAPENCICSSDCSLIANKNIHVFEIANVCKFVVTCSLLFSFLYIFFTKPSKIHIYLIWARNWVILNLTDSWCWDLQE